MKVFTLLTLALTSYTIAAPFEAQDLGEKFTQALSYVENKYHISIDMDDFEWLRTGHKATGDFTNSQIPVCTDSSGPKAMNTSSAVNARTTLSTSFLNATRSSEPTGQKLSSSVVSITAASVVESPTSQSETSASISSSGSHTGRGTFYEVGADNCGTSSTNSDLVCAISHSLYETSVNGEDISSYCGKTITANYNGNSVTVKVVDSCESCGDNDLDFSPAAFSKLADLDIGEIEITWSWD
ncbi:hypothetical protein KL933_003444 [Ogataea haglerorum]|uniref:RlpA-like protein double-psi beta-barrel domain-containing protein n=1 Tax=Ogataea haglerorum TaxID=1937702 RepID=A0AAN6D498_9ASCO|nr:uncharacterized protein KL911_003681 [Ogataea haglerorum]KAG7698502.1 hypothetical protein KL951_001766 [Ogataea haglerorum]KAG7708005.1 hypothetical protein KL950_002631 [Ogataea haglerorum]KAG7717197.1 hypothetical protein KL913_002948 [Ogataea haglerorum]KAG7719415.1 hypothetical protein KL949_002407 [Ogataea haglerorum]KAG7726513.1 hypothetical protein KL933_003444 [Ogataea haglerorum]